MDRRRREPERHGLSSLIFESDGEEARWPPPRRCIRRPQRRAVKLARPGEEEEIVVAAMPVMTEPGYLAGYLAYVPSGDLRLHVLAERDADSDAGSRAGDEAEVVLHGVDVAGAGGVRHGALDELLDRLQLRRQHREPHLPNPTAPHHPRASGTRHETPHVSRALAGVGLYLGASETREALGHLRLDARGRDDGRGELGRVRRGEDDHVVLGGVGVVGARREHLVPQLVHRVHATRRVRVQHVVVLLSLRNRPSDPEPHPHTFPRWTSPAPRSSSPPPPPHHHRTHTIDLPSNPTPLPHCPPSQHPMDQPWSSSSPLTPSLANPKRLHSRMLML
eukprot:1229051-Rhodomonas_salina.2